MMLTTGQHPTHHTLITINQCPLCVTDEDVGDDVVVVVNLIDKVINVLS